MTTEPKDWIFEGTPTSQGWHAILYSWSEEEGVFAGADRWTGAAWERGYPTLAIAGPFLSLGAAEAWARAHDPDELYAQSLRDAAPPTATGKGAAPEMPK